jgi:hypothetical protein
VKRKRRERDAAQRTKVKENDVADYRAPLNKSDCAALRCCYIIFIVGASVLAPTLTRWLAAECLMYRLAPLSAGRALSSYISTALCARETRGVKVRGATEPAERASPIIAT